MNKPKWTRKLSKKDLSHLAETNSTGKPLLRALVGNLKATAADGLGNPCLQCRSIAQKLNIDPDTGLKAAKQ